jgi:predicted metal-dependent phosphoesterase TrpH
LRKRSVYKEHVGIDLHIHSTASDGTLSPLEILRLARKLNLGAIAITDHDTVDGAKEALALEIPASLQFLTGVEISAEPPPSFSSPGSFHILGYAIDPDDPVLNQTLRKLQEARKNRNPRIIEILNDLGFNLALSEVQEESGECQLGRPHIAQLMVTKGYVHSIDEAFDRYLGKGRPAYVDKYRIGSARAIEIILDAGGVPVLAHPFLLQAQDDTVLEDLVVTLMEMGLMGMEVYYPEHPPDKTADYIKIAKKHRLLMTGGTDFHGAIKPEIQMGFGNGDLFIPYELYERLIQSNKQKSPENNDVTY